MARDVLRYILDDPTRALQRLKLPNGRYTNNQINVDNSILYLKANKTNLDIAMDIFNTFCRPKSKWKKSIKIWAFEHPHLQSLAKDPSLKWLAQETTIRYLGFSIGFIVPPKNITNKIIYSLTNRLKL